MTSKLLSRSHSVGKKDLGSKRSLHFFRLTGKVKKFPSEQIFQLRGVLTAKDNYSLVQYSPRYGMHTLKNALKDSVLT